MIYIFRKEIKKWHLVLWIVFAGLCFSSLPMIFRGANRMDQSAIATVNGEAISFKEFKQCLAETQMGLDSLRRYARMLGMSEEMLLQNYYHSANPQEIALKTAIKEKLLDQVKAPFDIHIANDDLMELLVNSMPAGLLDERGLLNMDAYNAFVKHMGITSEEYESRKEAEVSRKLFEQFILNSFYLPRYLVKDAVAAQHGKKNFSVAVFSHEHYLAEAKKEQVDKAELVKFYEQHKDSYLVPEKKKARFWRISPSSYASTVEVDDYAVSSYYEKNKSSQFRIAPKISIRRILLQGDKAAERAKRLHEELKAQSKLFAERAKEFSDDKESAGNGGLTGLFARGTYDKAVEDAAFRLRNIGDVSDIITTPKGCELIQLAERVSATEEPLEKVKDKIIASLKATKSLERLKSDLATVLHKVKENPEAFNDFAAERNLKVEETELIDKSAMNKPDFTGKIAEQLFSSSKSKAARGYFFSGSDYVLYTLIDEQKSHVLEYKVVQQSVIDRYVAARAQENMMKDCRTLKEKVLHEGMLFADLAQQPGVRVVETGLIGADEQVAALKDFKQLAARAFQIHDKSLILMHPMNHDLCLVQLIEEQLDADKDQVEKIQSEIKKENSYQAHNHVNSFIASLERNAKIERFDVKSPGKTGNVASQN